MSERDDKTFDPTPRRLQKAREEGNVFRSREVVSSISLLIGGGLLVYGLPVAFTSLQQVWEQLFLRAATTPLTVGTLAVLLRDLGVQLTILVAPLFITVVVVGVGLNILQSGWSVSAKPLTPKGSRINPGEGIKRIFSKRGTFDLLKSLVKVAIVAPIAYGAIKDRLPEILMLHTLSLENVMSVSGSWIVALVSQITLALLALALVDFFFEKKRYNDDLKMSRQEVVDEAKEQEGDPQMKGKRRQRAREILQRPRLDHAILKADVVITNPTHYAVALRYDPTEADAPRVLVKGIRKRALRIKELAAQHSVPTIENRPLARALYGNVEEGKPIPEDLYPAVAAILAEIFRNRGRM